VLLLPVPNPAAAAAALPVAKVVQGGWVVVVVVRVREMGGLVGPSAAAVVLVYLALLAAREAWVPEEAPEIMLGQVVQVATVMHGSFSGSGYHDCARTL